MKFSQKILRIDDFEKCCFFESAILISKKKKKKNAFFPWNQVKVYLLVRLGQNFDRAKCNNNFWPRPNILMGSVAKNLTLIPFWLSKFKVAFLIYSVFLDPFRKGFYNLEKYSSLILRQRNEAGLEFRTMKNGVGVGSSMTWEDCLRWLIPIQKQ